MNKAQENALRRFEEQFKKDYMYGDGYEVKRREVKENELFISFIIVVGLKGDENSVYNIFTRDKAHIFIGRHGGISGFGQETGKALRGLWSNLRQKHQ